MEENVTVADICFKEGNRRVPKACWRGTSFGKMEFQELAASMEGFAIGLIGMGDMGKMYARRLSDAGWR